MSIIRIVTLATVFSTLYLISCAGIPSNGRLEPFLQQFEAEVGVKPRGVSLYFKKLPERVAGRCILGVRIVQIDPEFFFTLTYQEQKALMFHEIAHCVCNEYRHAKVKSGCGDSIMEPAMKNYWCYVRYWSKYMKDLRKRCK